nr:hypothetical protein [uncultured Lachnoclostridium sp.]
MTGNSITGRKENVAYDFYETPKWATEKAVKAMLRDKILNKKEFVYEPCVGTGAITDVLEMYGFENIEASDIQTADYIKGMKGVDVYEVEDNACDVVITNPPYNLMTKGNMLAEFQRIAEKKVILLLNIFYLSSKDRKQMLENSSLRHIYIHSDRATMFPYGQEKPKNGGTKMYAWYVWDKEYTGKPTLSWI